MRAETLPIVLPSSWLTLDYSGESPINSIRSASPGRMLPEKRSHGGWRL